MPPEVGRDAFHRVPNSFGNIWGRARPYEVWGSLRDVFGKSHRRMTIEKCELTGDGQRPLLHP
jgi:hypothetical protein